ncbi:MAG: BNR/Asp-box repeat domain protein [Myxococcaceae bacterium]|nr:BNR/Asp-box repeat domain protein [Myxococcaceae bacterium]
MNPRAARSLLALAAAALAAAPALANGRFPAAQQVVLGPGARSDVIALRTTFGALVSRDGGASFHWYCEDLLYFPFVPGVAFDPPFEVSSRGEVVLGFEDGAHALTDGCAVTDLASVSHREITDLAATPDGATLYAAESTTGSRSYILRADAALVFQRMGAGVDRLRLVTVEVAASRPLRVYASGFDDSPSRTPRVVRSDDGGATLVGITPTESLGDAAYVAGVDPTDPDVLYLRTVEGFGSTLLRSADGGAHLAVVARTADPMTAFALSDDGATVWYGSGDGGLYRSTDRGLHFTQLGMIPALGLRFHAGSLWLVTDWLRQPWALGRSADGGDHFEPVLRFEDVAGPPVCASASEATAICNDRWPAFRSTIATPARPDAGAARDATTDAPTVDAPPAADAGLPDAGRADAGVAVVTVHDDCGCHAGAARGGGWWLALAALVGLRRRRVSIATGLQ